MIIQGTDVKESITDMFIDRLPMIQKANHKSLDKTNEEAR